jgi:imidazolonepropionase-like amidohydrolase
MGDDVIATLLAAALVVTDVTVVDVERGRLEPHRTVVVDAGRIEAVVPAVRVPAPEGAVTIDGRGKFLIPGLIDAHTHLTILEKGALARDAILPSFLHDGVTGVRDMGGDLDILVGLRAAVASGEIVGPRFVTPGPFLDGEGAPPFTRVVADPGEAVAAVDEVKRLGADFVKVQAKLTLAAWRAIVRASAERGMAVVGHVPEAVSAFEVAASGQRTIEHVSPALPGDAGVMMACSSEEEALRRERAELDAYGDRDDADPAAYKARQRAWQKRIVDTFDPRRCRKLAGVFRKHHVVWVPTQVWSERFAPLAPESSPPDADWGSLPEALRRRWTERRAQVVARSTPEDFAARRAMFDASSRLVRFMHEHGVVIAAGTDSTDTFDLPGDGLHREMELLVSSGFTPAEALRAATVVAAEAAAFGDAGVIAAGKRADLVLLFADPLLDVAHTRKISGIVLSGRWIAR